MSEPEWVVKLRHDAVAAEVREAFELGRAQGWREACEEGEAKLMTALPNTDARWVIRALAARGPKEGA